MVWRIRSALELLIGLGLIVACAGILQRRWSFFDRGLSALDARDGARTVLTTLAGTTTTIAAITVAVIFITVQIVARPGQTRLLAETYETKFRGLVLGLFFVALASSIVCLIRLEGIIKTGDLRPLDLTVVVNLAGMAILVPLTLRQFENTRPTVLAAKLARRITAKRIRAYGLAEVSRRPLLQGGVDVKVRQWGLEHRGDDPLGALHELIMQAVQARDRILLSALIRVLLKRVAHYCSVPFPELPRYRTASETVLQKIGRRLYVEMRNAPDHDVQGAEVAVHILHYAIRRARNLIIEWGERDVVRQAFVRDIIDLARAMSLGGAKNGQIIELCFFAVLRICLDYSAIERYGRQEPLLDMFSFVGDLERNGLEMQSQTCAEVLGLIVARTQQVPVDARRRGEVVLPPTPKRYYERAVSRATSDPRWLPESTDWDPWRPQSSP